MWMKFHNIRKNFFNRCDSLALWKCLRENSAQHSLGKFSFSQFFFCELWMVWVLSWQRSLTIWLLLSEVSTKVIIWEWRASRNLVNFTAHRFIMKAHWFITRAYGLVRKLRNKFFDDKFEAFGSFKSFLSLNLLLWNQEALWSVSSFSITLISYCPWNGFFTEESPTTLTLLTKPLRPSNKDWHKAFLFFIKI